MYTESISRGLLATRRTLAQAAVEYDTTTQKGSMIAQPRGPRQLVELSKEERLARERRTLKLLKETGGW